MTAPDPTEAFRKALNRHGYGFQHALLKEARRLFGEKSPWMPWIPEFPIEVQNRGTRIDVIFFHREGLGKGERVLLLGECKRANPATANWCFARGWQWQENPGMTRVEVVSRSSAGEVKTWLKELAPDPAYDVALEVRTGEKGDGGGKGRGEIEEAATQVLRGLNGLIEFLRVRGEQLLGSGTAWGLVPVIFTTAKIHATTASITEAALTTGELAALDPPLKEVPWVWYDYPQSPGLKHSVVPGHLHTDLEKVLEREFVRRVAVVSPAGLEDFLGSHVWRHGLRLRSLAGSTGEAHPLPTSTLSHTPRPPSPPAR